MNANDVATYALLAAIAAIGGTIVLIFLGWLVGIAVDVWQSVL